MSWNPRHRGRGGPPGSSQPSDPNNPNPNDGGRGRGRGRSPGSGDGGGGRQSGSSPGGWQGRAQGGGGGRQSGRSPGRGDWQRGAQAGGGRRQSGRGGQNTVHNLTQGLQNIALNAPPAAPSVPVTPLTPNELSQHSQRMAAERNQRAAQREAKNQERQRALAAWREAESKMPDWKDRAIADSDARTTGPDIRANFFSTRLDVVAGGSINKYRIELDKGAQFEPGIREVRRALISNLLAAPAGRPSARTWVSDYFSHIVSVGRLYSTSTNVKGSTVPVRHAGLGTGNIDSLVIFEGSIDHTDLNNYLNRQPLVNASYHPDEDLKALNIITWSAINLGNWLGARVGNKFYPDSLPASNIKRVEYVRELNDNLEQDVYEARSGFFTSMRPGTQSLMLNVHLTTSAFFPHGNLQTFINNRWSPLPVDHQDPCIPPQEASVELKGLKVTFDGLPNRTFSVCGVSDQRCSVQRFGQTANSPGTIVFNHMMATYGPGGTNAPQPPASLTFDGRAATINVGARNDPRWYPADHLTILPRQVAKGKVLDSSMVPSMLIIARKNPQQVQYLIRETARGALGIEPTFPMNPPPPPGRPQLGDFGLAVNQDFIHFKSRYLDQPTLQFGNNVDIKLMEVCRYKERWQKASWDLTKVGHFRTVQPGACPTLKLIRITQDGRRPAANPPIADFATHFIRDLRRYGFTLSSFNATRDLRLVNWDSSSGDARIRRGDFENALDMAYRELGNPTLLVIILPSKDANIYSDIKWWADCVKGIPTVCVSTRDSFFRAATGARGNGDPNTLANLSMKFNFKNGGTNHRLFLPAEWSFYGAKPNTMIVGADVSHVGRESSSPSMAGVVATCDENSGNYLASARLQPANTEHIENLRSMMEERLRAWTGRLEHILFYRDGVSESQYGMVVASELPQIQEACRAVGRERRAEAGWLPGITLVVVGKRHHTRFFPGTNMPEPDKNLQAGLIVDHDVIHPRQFSFYLQSHDSPIGTARSGHYVVLENTSNYTMAELQETTHRICFTGSRATKSLSVCTPARYADILCDRLRHYMRPLLYGQIRFPQITQGPNSRDLVINDFRAERTLWAQAGANIQGNPWHARLNNCMFYL